MDGKREAAFNSTIMKTNSGKAQHRQVLNLEADKIGIKISIRCKDTEVVKQLHYMDWTNKLWLNVTKFPDLDSLCSSGLSLLNGNHLVVSGFSIPPFLVPDPQAGRFNGGVALRILQVLSEVHGFTWSPMLAKDWAIYHHNGTLGGSLWHVRMYYYCM